MARAKRTDRAEARRRYRAAQGFTDAELDAAELEDDARASSPGAQKPARPASGTPAPMPARIGIGQAFRQAFRPLDLRGDLAALPTIAVRSKALWVPIALTLAATALVAIVGTLGTEPVNAIANFGFVYFISAGAIGSVFITGFLAPRASWLLGFIVGVVATIAYIGLIVAVPLKLSLVAPTPDEVRDAATAAFLSTPVTGALFASAAAWYRRFLALSSPNRNRRTAANSGRPNGKSRAANARR